MTIAISPVLLVYMLGKWVFSGDAKRVDRAFKHGVASEALDYYRNHIGDMSAALCVHRL